MNDQAKVEAALVAFEALQTDLYELGLSEYQESVDLLEDLGMKLHSLRAVPVDRWICKDCLFRCLRENTCDNAEATDVMRPQAVPSECELYVGCGASAVPVRGEV